MTTSSDDALPTLQREVQRLLGRCMLRLQQYERLIKAIVADHEISGPAHALEAVRAARVADTGRKTLGALVGELLGSYIVADQIGTSAEPTAGSPGDDASFSFRMRLELSEADFHGTENVLKELVLLRNSLVHHFIDQHDLWNLDGCRNAQDALVAAYSRIDQHLGRLREWAEDMARAKRLTFEWLQSDEVREILVNGISRDGTVDWPDAGIVRALREAAGELAVDGWAPVARAAKWITERYPEQLPATYGCSSWRQVVHQSRVFELRRFQMDGERSAFYREKGSFANPR